MSDAVAMNKNSKLFGILCYLGVFILIPLFKGRDDEFVKFHINQGLIVLVLEIAGIILAYIPVIGIVGSIIYLFAFVMLIIGIVNVAKEKMAPLPLIGGIQLIK